MIYNLLRKNIVNTLANPMWSKLMCAGISEVPPRWKYRTSKVKMSFFRGKNVMFLR